MGPSFGNRVAGGTAHCGNPFARRYPRSGNQSIGHLGQMGIEGDQARDPMAMFNHQIASVTAFAGVPIDVLNDAAVEGEDRVGSLAPAIPA